MLILLISIHRGSRHPHTQIAQQVRPREDARNIRRGIRAPNAKLVAEDGRKIEHSADQRNAKVGVRGPGAGVVGPRCAVRGAAVGVRDGAVYTLCLQEFGKRHGDGG